MISRKNVIVRGMVIVLILISCKEKESVELEQVKEEVRQTEADFNRAVAENGLKSAFVEFADEAAALNRRGTVIKGKEAIASYFDGFDYASVTLTWEPDFVEVADAGDLAYTYGQFTFISQDSIGAEQQSNGIFHTVWKKQADGSWKYVWD